ncbi:MAG: lysophospholipid acyltransferase family protein [Bryobacter sp.]|nr:lysophospholipid acyltransferase family protein [Bryobacter sp.]
MPAIKLLFWLLRVLPESAAMGLARAVFGVLDKAVPKLRRTALRNFAIAGVPYDEKTVDALFRGLARMLFYFARFPTRTRENIGEWIEYQGFEHFAEAKRRGKGVLFATGHIGNWELSAFSHALMAEPMHVVVRPLDNPQLDALVKGYRSLSGNTILDKKDFLRGILAALARNEAVGILIDQNTLPEHGAFVEFFGVKACTGTTFAKLAHKTGAAVIPGYAYWDEKRAKYILQFDPILEMTGEVVADTARLARHFEGVIRQRPDQWLWLHRRWKSRPPGEGNLY